MKILRSPPSRKWQAVIPKELRRLWDVSDPSRVDIIYTVKDADHVSISAEKKPSWRDIAGSLTGKAKVPYSILRNKKKVDALIGGAVVQDLLKEL